MNLLLKFKNSIALRIQWALDEFEDQGHSNVKSLIPWFTLHRIQYILYHTECGILYVLYCNSVHSYSDHHLSDLFKILFLTKMFLV